MTGKDFLHNDNKMILKHNFMHVKRKKTTDKMQQRLKNMTTSIEIIHQPMSVEKYSIYIQDCLFEIVLLQHFNHFLFPI